MTFISKLYNQDITISDGLKLVFNNSKSHPLLTEQNVIFIAGFTGSGKSTLIKKLIRNLEGFTEIPERRIITLKGIIEPYAAHLSLQCNFNNRADRIDIVKNYKKNIPEGIVFPMKHIRITKKIQKGFIFDGIRGEEELKNVLEVFKKAKVIVLNASKEKRLNRIIERKDSYDQMKNSPYKKALEIVENDLDLHGNFNRHKNKGILYLNTNILNKEAVFLAAYNWILDNY